MRYQSRVLMFAGLVSLAAHLSSGCVSLPGGAKPLPAADSLTATLAAEDSIPRFIDVEIDNHNWSDVVVYILHGGTRTRLGTAGTARSTEFRFPASYAFASTVSLLVTPIGSPARFESERFKVAAGQRVLWTIETSLVRSSLMIR